MNENNTEQLTSSKRRRRRSSAAQKILIIIMLAVLAALGGVIYHAAKHPHAAEIIDQLKKGEATVAMVPATTTETTSVTTETTTTSGTTTSAETTTDEQTTETTTGSGLYSTSFIVQFPQSFGGQYSISVVYPNTDETTEVNDIIVPETTYMEIELSYPEASIYVPAQVYLTNELNGKQALAGTVNLDFANDLCDQSGLDIYTALLEVQ